MFEKSKKITKIPKKMLNLVKKHVIICMKGRKVSNKEAPLCYNVFVQIPTCTKIAYSKEVMKVMCKAAEVGKIVVNKCLDHGILVDTQKLQKLLVLMQVECIRRSGKPLFKEDVRIWNCGVAIKEVDDEFNIYGQGFNEKIEEFITLLELEEQSVDYILETYGTLDAFDLNQLPDNKRVMELGITTEGSNTPHVSYQIMTGAFLK